MLLRLVRPCWTQKLELVTPAVGQRFIDWGGSNTALFFVKKAAGMIQ